MLSGSVLKPFKEVHAERCMLMRIDRLCNWRIKRA